MQMEDVQVRCRQASDDDGIFSLSRGWDLNPVLQR